MESSDRRKNSGETIGIDSNSAGDTILSEREMSSMGVIAALDYSKFSPYGASEDDSIGSDYRMGSRHHSNQSCFTFLYHSSRPPPRKTLLTDASDGMRYPRTVQMDVSVTFEDMMPRTAFS